MNKYNYIFVLVILLFACNKENSSTAKTSSDQTKQKELFSVLPPIRTGINFTNNLKESTYMNGLFYEYFYNGGGVAAADFNNDDLIDIYFINNLKSNSLYINQGGLKFKDVTFTSNSKGSYGFATGVTVVDINHDGLMDIYICKSGKLKDESKRRNELLVNQGNDRSGNPVFIEKAKEYGLDLPHFSTQASFFDYDKDGDLDMFLINHGVEMYDENDIAQLKGQKSKERGERLYRNENNTFKDVTNEAGIINNMLGYCLGIAIGDVNNDNWPDVYIGNDFSGKDHLYLNQKNGTFKEISDQAFGHVSNFSMGNDMADINNDGLLDIMSVDMMAEDNFTQKTSMSGMSTEKFLKHTDLGLHNQYMYNALQLNNGVNPKTGMPKFSDIAQLAGVSSTDWSWSPLFFDMDNDGYKDLFVSNGVKRDFRNNDFIIYHKIKQGEVEKNKSIDTEKYIANLLDKMPTRKKENYFLVNNSNLTFEKTDISQKPTSSNGAAYADFDNDGDIDIVVNNSDEPSYIYENNSSSDSNFLKIKLHGIAQNPFGVGAKIEIFNNGQMQIAERYFTRGFQSAMADHIHFGLKENTSIDSLKVTWADGSVQKMDKISSNQTLSLSYEPSEKRSSLTSVKDKKIFSDISDELNIQFKHKENDYNDFIKESLIPHRMSQLGPALTAGDVNNDGLEDFYIGGAKGQPGRLFTQNKNKTFSKSSTLVFENDRNNEDTGALFFDADNDGDLDLYVISGGNEEEPNHIYYKDRFYENMGNGSFEKNSEAIPQITSSGLKVVSGDYDNDGDLDLFVGSRVLPGHYGQMSKSYLLKNNSENGTIKFVDVTEKLIPEMINHTMVTDVLWKDIDKDGLLDLIVANEWGPIEVFKNNKLKFLNRTSELGLANQIGWWSSLAISDIDNDGDLDIIAGNLGLNYKYKASDEAGFHMYLNDFDDNKTDDIVLGYNQNNTVYPLRGRECSSNQMSFVKEKYKSYNDYGNADLVSVYGEKLNEGIHYTTNNFATSILLNQNNESFEFKPFENSVQISSVNEILISDFDDDGFDDIALLGNLYGSEVETPRNDASYGHFMKGNGNGEFKLVDNRESGLWAEGDVKGAIMLSLGGEELEERIIILAKNNSNLIFVKCNM